MAINYSLDETCLRTVKSFGINFYMPFVNHFYLGTAFAYSVI